MIYVSEMECYKCDNYVQGFYDVVNDQTVYECDECGWTYVDESELVKTTEYHQRLCVDISKRCFYNFITNRWIRLD